jgi:hypothetical protein
MKAILFISVFLLASCSANYHVQLRQLKKGTVATRARHFCNKFNRLNSVRFKGLYYVGKGISPKDTIVRYKRSYVPKTRLETRIEYKLKRDTIKMLEKVEVVKWKTERNKKTKANLWLL